MITTPLAAAMLPLLDNPDLAVAGVAISRDGRRIDTKVIPKHQGKPEDVRGGQGRMRHITTQRLVVYGDAGVFGRPAHIEQLILGDVEYQVVAVYLTGGLAQVVLNPQVDEGAGQGSGLWK